MKSQEPKPDRKTTLHGSAVAIGGAAVFLRGPSGSGKSDLCFRLIEQGGALLVSDDQVLFEWRQEKVFAATAETIRGLLEVRGLGLFRYEPSPSVPLKLIVDLVPREAVPRLPERETAEILGASFPRLQLHAFDASASLKVLKAMEITDRPGLLVE
jgi:serine kinase of HPr protein (carbohydrate metabolism regulator)